MRLALKRFLPLLVTSSFKFGLDVAFKFHHPFYLSYWIRLLVLPRS